jgi:hypothetical protein
MPQPAEGRGAIGTGHTISRLLVFLLVLLALDSSALGAEPKLLWTVPGLFCQNPIWSPNGAQVACWHGRYQVYENGRLVRELDRGDEAVWSPDSRSLVTLDKYADLFGISLWNASGLAGVIRALKPEEAAWSPDGKTIWYNSGALDYASLFVANAKDVWSHERVRQLFEKCLGEPRCIEKEVPPLQPRGPGWRPAASRDGHIAFLRYRALARTNQLWLLRKGESEPVIIRSPDINRAVWSPDGRWLAAITSCEGRFCLEVLDLRHEETGFRRLSELEEATLSWSPDSRSIAFLRRLPPPEGVRPPARPGSHVPHDPPDRAALARVSISSGRVVDVLVPKQPHCTYQMVAWSKGGLLTHLRCYPPGAPAYGNNDLLVYDVQ